MLVAAGASLSLKDHDGNPPRVLAQKANDQELAAYLESKSGLRSLREAMLSAQRKARSPSPETPLREGFVSSGTQTCITLTTHSAACAEALSQALVEALSEEEARIRGTNKRLRVERLI